MMMIALQLLRIVFAQCHYFIYSNTSIQTVDVIRMSVKSLLVCFPANQAKVLVPADCILPTADVI